MNNILSYVLLGPFALGLLFFLVCLSIYAYAKLKFQYFNKETPNCKLGKPLEKSMDEPASENGTEAVSAAGIFNEGTIELKDESPIHKQELKIKKSQDTLEERIKLLERQIVEGVVTLQSDKPEIFTYALCFVFQLDVKKFKDPGLGWDLITSIYKSLGLDTQIRESGEIVVPQHPNVQQMLYAVLSSAYGMIKNSKENFQIVFDYKLMLQSKLRSLSHTDEYGDPDYSIWVKFSSKFSVDKLKGFFDLKMYIEMSASTGEREKIVRSGLADMYGHYVRAMLTLLMKFDTEEDSPPITGQDYEFSLKRKIEERFEDAYVEMTPATGDHGGDLIIDIKNTRLVIQAKYYKSNVGNDAIQEAYSGRGYYRADYAMVVCDSGYTKHAIDLATQLEVILCTTGDFLSRIDMIAYENY